MTTRALAESCLNFPLMIDVYSMNSFEQAFDIILHRFAPLRELISRKDAGSTLVKAYEDLGMEGGG